jgi:hypothetical protein
LVEAELVESGVTVNVVTIPTQLTVTKKNLAYTLPRQLRKKTLHITWNLALKKDYDDPRSLQKRPKISPAPRQNGLPPVIDIALWILNLYGHFRTRESGVCRLQKRTQWRSEIQYAQLTSAFQAGDDIVSVDGTDCEHLALQDSCEHELKVEPYGTGNNPFPSSAVARAPVSVAIAGLLDATATSRQQAASRSSSTANTNSNEQTSAISQSSPCVGSPATSRQCQYFGKALEAESLSLTGSGTGHLNASSSNNAFTIQVLPMVGRYVHDVEVHILIPPPNFHHA